jgi:3-hydroxyacyl-[acyl-carrier-protein] dehydratase
MSEHPLPIPADHPAYPGHFPGQPILPGVVLLDAALHVLAAQQGLPEPVQIKSVKFLSPVQPGEALTLHTADLPTGGVRFEIRCLDRRGGERSVASGSLVFAQAAPT